MKRPWLVLLAAITMGSVACSGPSGAGAGGGPLDACTLIGAQRAGAILGQTVTTKQVGPRPAKASDASECVYSTGSIDGGFMLIAARLGFDDAKAEARSQMATARKDHPPPGIPRTTVRMVDGPGQAAFLGTSSASTELHVLDHGVSLVVSISQPESPAVLARLRKLAEAALEQLGT